MKFKMFKKKKLKNLILNKSKIINGSVCIDEGKTFKRNNYDFFVIKINSVPLIINMLLSRRKLSLKI